MADLFLLEDGSGLLLEDGSSALLLESSGAVAPALPPNLMAAISAKANADATLAGVAGGFWRGQLPATPAGQPPPASYCVFTRTRTSHLMLTNTSEWKDVTIRFRVYAEDGDQAEALGDLVMLGVRKWGPLYYANGHSIPLIEVGGMSDATKNRRLGDKAAWFVEILFSARCRRGIA